MHAAKTPEQIAATFGCTVAQARAQIEGQVKRLQSDLAKCQATKNGKLRGLPLAWYQDRLAAFSAVL